MPESVRRSVGLGLLATTIAAFVLLSLAVWRVQGLAKIWPVIAVLASTSSLLLLAAFWNSQLVFGVSIDIALIVLVLIRPGWAVNI